MKATRIEQQKVFYRKHNSGISGKMQFFEFRYQIILFPTLKKTHENYIDFFKKKKKLFFLFKKEN